MTIPVLPYVDRSNLALDLSTAGASIAKGLEQERAKRREEAMAEALMEIKKQQAMQGPRPSHIVAQTPQGLRHAFADPFSGETLVTDTPAPESQWFYSSETGQPMSVPRYQKNAPAVPVPGVDGQTAPPIRDAPPLVAETELPTGGAGFTRIPRRGGTAETVTQPSGEPVRATARQFEVEKAQFAANMSRAAAGMENIVMSSPAAVDEAITRLNSQAILSTLPVIGATAGEVARVVSTLGLSPEAANWLVHFHTFLGFAVPELAGKQMTLAEMRQQTAMFAPLSNEPESARRLKRENIRFRVDLAQQAAGSGVARLGPDAFNQTPTAPTAPKRNRFGFVKPTVQ